MAFGFSLMILLVKMELNKDKTPSQLPLPTGSEKHKTTGRYMMWTERQAAQLTYDERSTALTSLLSSIDRTTFRLVSKADAEVGADLGSDNIAR